MHDPSTVTCFIEIRTTVYIGNCSRRIRGACGIPKQRVRSKPMLHRTYTRSPRPLRASHNCPCEPGMKMRIDGLSQINGCTQTEMVSRLVRAYRKQFPQQSATVESWMSTQQREARR